MNRFASRLLCVACAALSLLALPDRAAAAVRPYKATGGAQFVGPNDFVGSGQATHLGRYSEAGHVEFTPTNDPAILHVEGTIVYTAANGDELHAVVTGELNAVTGVVDATVAYAGGTGRFATASSSSSLAGRLGPNGTISVVVEGKIDF